MTKKQIVRTILFALIVCYTMVVLCELFEHENTYNYDRRFYSYRELPEDTVDAVYIGTSGVDRYWIAAKAYEDYGMTVYPLTSDGTPSWLYVNLIEEVYAHQNPELILLDTRAFGQLNTEAPAMDAAARRVLDAMDLFSVNRFKMALKTMDILHQIDETNPRWDISYLLSFVKFHSKWLEEDYRFKNNIGNTPHSYAGFFINSNLSVTAEAMTVPATDIDPDMQLDPISEKALYDLIDYIKANNLNVLFVETPQFRDKVERSVASRINNILEEEGMEYLHFYNEDGTFTMEFDLAKDFYNKGHVNYYGAVKFTDEFAKYLDEHYDLPDRRDEEAVQQAWNGKYKAIKGRIKRMEKAVAGK